MLCCAVLVASRNFFPYERACISDSSMHSAVVLVCAGFAASFPLQPAKPQQQQQATERWMPPKREPRQKAPTPVKGQKQVVLWNPNHKFLHIRDGEGRPACLNCC
jgi:hypothetical protein